MSKNCHSDDYDVTFLQSHELLTRTNGEGAQSSVVHSLKHSHENLSIQVNYFLYILVPSTSFILREFYVLTRSD